ncbi:MAG: RNA polymerase sigma factor [Bacteroidota bacterium]
MTDSKEHNTLDWELKIITDAKRDISYFEPIYEKFYDKILRFTFRRVDSVDMAADLTAQTFLKAMADLPKYQVRGISILNWLYKIASNEVKQYYRKTKQEKSIYLEEEDIYRIKYEEPEGQESEFEKEKLIVVLNKISISDLEIIELKFFEGLTFEEISYIKQMKLSAVKMKVYRSLEKLRKLLK